MPRPACRSVRAIAPAPGIPEPPLRQHDQFSIRVAAVADRDTDVNLRRAGFGIRDFNVPITPVIKRARIKNAERGIGAAPECIFIDQLPVGVGRLRIFVEILQPGVGGQSGLVKIGLFYIFAMVALFARQPECTLFQNRIFFIP